MDRESMGFMGSQRVGHNWETELNWTQFIFPQKLLLLLHSLSWLKMSSSTRVKTLESSFCLSVLLFTFISQSWIFIGRTDTEVEAPILWPPDAKNWLTGIDPDARKDWRQEEKGITEDETVGWHHQLDGHEFEQAPGVGDGHGSLACYSPWGRKELDTTEQQNWTENLIQLCYVVVSLEKQGVLTVLPRDRKSVV